MRVSKKRYGVCGCNECLFWYLQKKKRKANKRFETLESGGSNARGIERFKTKKNCFKPIRSGKREREKKSF